MKISPKQPFEKGYNEYLNKKDHPTMMGMEFGVVAMSEGDVLNFNYAQEVVYTLTFGEIIFSFEGKTEKVKRDSCFREAAILLHVPQNTEVKIECLSETAEVSVARTDNSRSFPVRLLYPKDCLCEKEERGFGIMNDCSARTVQTFFDRSTCPETNFFLGEVVHTPGKWSSYPPHRHEEPELYYYKFLPENGYGLAEYGDGAYKVKHNELTAMEARVTHSQVCTPGHAEYYLWCIRLQDDKNIITTDVEEYKWLLDKDAKIFPDV